MSRSTRQNSRVGLADTTSANPNVLRTLTKLAAGTAIKVSFIGDSGLEGNTVTTPGTDDAASRFCAGLQARFGATVTKSNRAVSGHTASWAMDPSLFSPTKFALALSDVADLYVIGFGHNDIRSDIISSAFLPGTGYPVAASRSAIEHMVRRIRLEVPEADIIITNEWPYTGTSTSSNTALVAHGNVLRRIAAQYGCAFVDYYAALLALGVNSGREDTYIWPTGATGGNASGQHPNDAGHAVWSNQLLATLPRTTTLPAAPTPGPVPQPIFGAERYTATQWLTIPVFTGPVLPARWRLLGAGWSAAATTPSTTSTVNDSIEVQAVGTEIVLRIDTGPTGTVKVEVDGAVYNASLNLAALGSGQARFPFTGLAPGAHRIVVTLLSGSMTFRGALYMPCVGQRIPYDSALLTYTGTWANTASDSKVFDKVTNSTSTVSDTVTVQFVGTALAFSGLLYAATHIVGVTVDGGTEASQEWNSGGTLTQQGGRMIVSGLSYGRHIVVLRLASASRSLGVSHFFAYDETRTQRPTRMGGLAVVAEAVDFGNSLPAAPFVLHSPDDATSTSPASVTAATTSGLTFAGTASSRHRWMAETTRMAY